MNLKLNLLKPQVLISKNYKAALALTTFLYMRKQTFPKLLLIQRMRISLIVKMANLLTRIRQIAQVNRSENIVLPILTHHLVKPLQKKRRIRTIMIVMSKLMKITIPKKILRKRLLTRLMKIIQMTNLHVINLQIKQETITLIVVDIWGLLTRTRIINL